MEKIYRDELVLLLHDTVGKWSLSAGVEKVIAISGAGACLILMRLSLSGRSKADILREHLARESAGAPPLTFRERLGIRLDLTEHMYHYRGLGIDLEDWYDQIEPRLGLWAEANGFEKGLVVETASDCLTEMLLSLRPQSPGKLSIVDMPGTYHWRGVIKPKPFRGGDQQTKRRT